ncbi:MAG: hypothetical protein QG671_3257, partial [Actinomycetota bacterium]|nr:hypothetical protein [Actinomycetota bacterium]
MPLGGQGHSESGHRRLEGRDHGLRPAQRQRLVVGRGPDVVGVPGHRHDAHRLRPAQLVRGLRDPHPRGGRQIGLPEGEQHVGGEGDRRARPALLDADAPVERLRPDRQIEDLAAQVEDGPAEIT